MSFGARSNQPNKLGSIQIQTSEYGVPIPYAAGTVKLPLKLLDYVNFRADGQTDSGKGGGTVSSYEYFAAIDAAVCYGPINGIGNIYDSGGASSLVAATETYTIPSGGGTYSSQSQYTENDEGVTFQAPYSFTANDFGSDGETTFNGIQNTPMQEVASGTAVGAGQYSVVQDANVTSTSQGLITGSGGKLHYTFSAADAGKTVTITYTYTTYQTNYVSPAAKNSLVCLPGPAAGSVWGYMLSKYPARALSYPKIARVTAENFDLGSDATPPNVAVEVLNARGLSFGSGIADCDPAAILRDICGPEPIGFAWNYLGDLTAFSNFCVANNLFQSIAIDGQRKALDVMKDIINLANSAAVWSGGLLKVVPYGDSTAVANGRTFSPATTPVYELDYSDIICRKGEEPVISSWKGLADNYNSIQFQYTRRDDNYNNDVINDKDEASILMNGLLPMKTITGDNYRELQCAAVATNMLLKRNCVPLLQHTFKLKWWYQLLEPMDIVTIPTRLSQKTPVRIVSVEENEDYSLSIVAESFLFGVGTGVLYPKGLGSGSSPGAHDQPGSTIILAAFQPSTRLTGGDSELWLALTGGPSWGGCDVWLSTDNATYTAKPIARQYGSSRAGTVIAAVPAGTDPDTTDSFPVMTTGTLLSGTQANADSFATLCLVGEELISYETATLTGSTATMNSYNLGTYLRRGLFSTSNETHQPGEIFVRLDDQVTKYVLDSSLLGKTLYLKFTSFNLYGMEEQSLADVTALIVNLGAALTASTMLVGSYSNGNGTATVDVYVYNGAPGASGTATLANGATVVLPPQSWASEALATWYGVNFNPAASAYVLYTDRSAWLADQSTMLGIGSTTTPASGATGAAPTLYSDLGSYPTDNPMGAFGGSQPAVVSGTAYSSGATTTPVSNGPSGDPTQEPVRSNATTATANNAGNGTSDNGLCTWYGFAGSAAAAMTLSMSVLTSVEASGSSAAHIDLSYTLDGGSTWTTLLQTSGTLAQTAYSAPVPAGQNLANVQVQVSCFCTTFGNAESSVTAILSISQIQIA